MTGGDAAEGALLAQFREWLLAAHARVALQPEAIGPDEEPPPDLGSFYAALVALKEEVRRDARQRRRALEQSAESARAGEAWLRPELEAMRAELSRLRRDADEDRRRRELLEIVGLRDRAALAAAALTGAARRGGLAIRVSGLGALLGSLAQGQEMLLARFDELLGNRGVAAIPARGQAFDPKTMKAVEVDPAPGVPEGTVTEEIRPGYAWNERLLRPAEVRVARRPDGR